MKVNLKSCIDEIIKGNHLLEDGLYNGYINTTGLALIIQPYIKEKLGEKEVSFDSIKMALFRSSKSMKLPKKVKIFSTKNLYIKKNISIVSVTKDQDITKKAIRNIEKVKGHYLSKIEGNSEASIIFDEYYAEIMDELITDISKVSLTKDLVLIGIVVPEGTQETPGIIYSLSKQLMFFGINITQIIQTKKEFAVLVDEKDMQDTLYVISSL